MVEKWHCVIIFVESLAVTQFLKVVIRPVFQYTDMSVQFAKKIIILRQIGIQQTNFVSLLSPDLVIFSPDLFSILVLVLLPMPSKLKSGAYGYIGSWRINMF